MNMETAIIIQRLREIGSRYAHTPGVSVDDREAIGIAASVLEKCANASTDSPVLLEKIESLQRERDDAERDLFDAKDQARHYYQEMQVRYEEIRQLTDKIRDLQAALATMSIQYANRISSNEDYLTEIRLHNKRKEAGEDFDSDNIL